MSPRTRVLLGIAAWLTLFVPEVRAERLPIQSYGPAEGLPSTYVLHVMRDSRGFVWFSTRDGVSRFDGRRFVTYGTEDGLPDPTVNATIERRDGTYWMATNGGGVCRFDPDVKGTTSARSGTDRPAFRVYPVGNSMRTNRVNTLFEDRAGHLWAGTDGGLFRLSVLPEGGDGGIFEEVPLGLRPPPEGLGIITMAQSVDGTLWIGTTEGLVRYLPDGTRLHFTLQHASRSDSVLALLFDAQGRLWLGHQTGFVVLQPSGDHDGTRSGPTPSRRLVRAHHPLLLPPQALVPLPTQPGESQWFSIDANPAGDRVLALQALADGHIWLGTSRGLMEFDGTHMHQYSRSQGLSDFIVSSLAADADGNLWAATVAAGAMKLTRRGFYSYDETDGLGDPRIQAIFEDRQHALVTISGDWIVNRFDGHRFTHGRSRLARELLPHWGSQGGFLDSQDQWWLLTRKGLLRLPKGSSPEAIGGRLPVETLEQVDAGQLYEDRHGDIWIALRQAQVAVWSRRTGQVRTFTDADGIPDGSIAISAIAEDRAGNIWLGSRSGGLFRYKAGRFTHFGLHGTSPWAIITTLYGDAAGRMWAGSNRDGLIRVDATDSSMPRVTSYSRANGLWSDNVRSVVADRWGRIYAGTARGVDRLDPDTGRVTHYTTTDGLLAGFVNAAFRDAQGDLWFGTLKGLSRLHPEPDTAHPSAPVLIDSLLIAGRPQPLAQLGQPAVPDVVVPTDRRELQIEFFGIALGAGEALRYRTFLEGLDHDWSAPRDERTVHYSALAPGAYRFLVKAVRADGTESERPAIVQFTVLPARWQRAWFQILVLSAVLVATTMAYRLRVAHLLALERVRTRIASDLHDDIGATLVQIAVLSEVVQQQAQEQAHAQVPVPTPQAPLARIAQRSREAIASMSDIVWAINPQKDSLQATVYRMREFATEVLPGRGIALQFEAPPEDLPMSADLRRHLYLIFKEAVNNIVRHSGAARACIALRVDRRQLVLRISDNGRGFDPDGPDAGHGLQNMTARAGTLKGLLRMSSRPGETIIEATIPYAHRPRSHLF
jgi:ligand-binding sensor domain-containing protein/signal transduction histidine kinase